jgi:hypothetical protein
LERERERERGAVSLRAYRIWWDMVGLNLMLLSIFHFIVFDFSDGSRGGLGILIKRIIYGFLALSV